MLFYIYTIILEYWIKICNITIIEYISPFYRPYTRQCLANISVGTVGPTVGGTTTNLRSMRQKREAIDALRDQDNQESDLQGKPQFYPKLSSSKPVITQQKMRPELNPQLNSNETPRANPCQFSTFKSSPARVAPDIASPLDIGGLNLGPRETTSPSNNRANCTATPRDYSSVTNRLADGEASPNPSSFRQPDKQSYFFQSYKTEKNFEMMMMFDRPVHDEKKKVDHGDDVAASGGSLNCFSSVEKERGGDHDEKRQRGCTLGAGRHPHNSTHDARRDSGNVEFLEKEGEIFKISSSELLQDASAKKKRNFSFSNKEKTHRSLESLERSIDLSAKDSKSLDLLFEERSKAFFHGKQRSLDSSQKSKKSMDSSANKARKRPNFFQRVRRSWHFLLMQRRIKQRNKYERPLSGREKCEYFLRRLHKNDSLSDRDSIRHSRAELNLSFLSKPDDDAKKDESISNEKKDEKEAKVVMEEDAIIVMEDVKFRVMDEENKLPDGGGDVVDKPPEENDEKPPLVTENDIARKLQEVIGTEKKEHIVDWVVTIANLDALSHATRSNESVSYGILHGTLGILKGILFDIFLCVCI